MDSPESSDNRERRRDYRFGKFSRVLLFRIVFPIIPQNCALFLVSLSLDQSEGHDIPVLKSDIFSC